MLGEKDVVKIGKNIVADSTAPSLSRKCEHNPAARDADPHQPARSAGLTTIYVSCVSEGSPAPVPIADAILCPRNLDSWNSETQSAPEVSERGRGYAAAI